jgi:hypothetical protein
MDCGRVRPSAFSLEIDDHLELGGPLDREIGRLDALEDPFLASNPVPVIARP